MLTINTKITLNNGVEIPAFGLGVYKVEEGKEVEETVSYAIDLGYRLVDTAAFYDNEEGVGRAIRNSTIPREELFVTTKIWNSDQGYEETLQAFERSFQKLNIDYIDLLLVHWPVKGKYVDTWRALEKLYKEKKVRAIGVSNFTIEYLQDLMAHSTIKPMLNQVELHPKLSQKELITFCKEHDIHVQAWSPIARGAVLEEPLLVKLAEKYHKTTAQIILRWHLQNNVLIIPKSTNKERLESNASLYDFKLSKEDMHKIDSLNENKRFGADPTNFNF